MGTLGTAIYLAVVFVGGWWLTTRGIPKAAAGIGRRLGFRMRMTPITAKRIQRFKRIKRGYWSFLFLSITFVISLFLELIVNHRPLAIGFKGRVAFPAVEEWAGKALFFLPISSFHSRKDFGQAGENEVDYAFFRKCIENPDALRPEIRKAEEKMRRAEKRFKRLSPPGKDASEFQRERYARRKAAYEKRKGQYETVLAARKDFESGEAWILPTLYPFSPNKVRTDIEERPPNSPSLELGIPLGTTTSGRDVLVLLLYGYRISVAFALIVAFVGYFVGILVGGIQGYFGGWVDILSQRFVEIWGSIPFLFTIMLIGSLMTPNFLMLAVLMIVLRSWLGITFYVRGEFYREKAKDYVQAAIGAGVSDWKIIVKHILPNAMVPVVTFAPFGIVAYIGSLVSLDYLGFGLPPGTPSWGALLRMGLENVKFHPYLVTVPVVALSLTLFMVVMVGEAVREAFDPKVFSRLR